MDSAAKLRNQLDDPSMSGPFKIRAQKRCSTFPLVGSEGWTAQEGPHVLGTKPTRSISLLSRVRGHNKNRSHPEPAIHGPDDCALLKSDDAYEYDSDDEDKRNGVPITYAPDAGGPFRESIKQELEAEFNRLRRYGETLAATVREMEGGYQRLCELFLETDNTSSVEWTVEEKEEFLVLEDVFLDLREELFAVQDTMEHVHAQLCLFLDHAQPSSGFRRSWLRDEDAIVWSANGAADQRVRNGEYLSSDRGGVGCDVTRGRFLKYEYFWSGQEIGSPGAGAHSDSRQKQKVEQ